VRLSRPIKEHIIRSELEFSYKIKQQKKNQRLKNFEEQKFMRVPLAATAVFLIKI
jgi:hypothetical protein